MEDIEPNEDLIAAMRAIQPEGVSASYIIGHITYLLNEELDKVPADDLVMINHRTKEIELLEQVAIKIEQGDLS